VGDTGAAHHVVRAGDGCAAGAEADHQIALGSARSRKGVHEVCIAVFQHRGRRNRHAHGALDDELAVNRVAVAVRRQRLQRQCGGGIVVDPDRRTGGAQVQRNVASRGVAGHDEGKSEQVALRAVAQQGGSDGRNGIEREFVRLRVRGLHVDIAARKRHAQRGIPGRRRGRRGAQHRVIKPDRQLKTADRDSVRGIHAELDRHGHCVARRGDDVLRNPDAQIARQQAAILERLEQRSPSVQYAPAARLDAPLVA